MTCRAGRLQLPPSGPTEDQAARFTHLEQALFIWHSSSEDAVLPAFEVEVFTPHGDDFTVHYKDAQQFLKPNHFPVNGEAGNPVAVPRKASPRWRDQYQPGRGERSQAEAPWDRKHTDLETETVFQHVESILCYKG